MWIDNLQKKNMKDATWKGIKFCQKHRKKLINEHNNKLHLHRNVWKLNNKSHWRLKKLKCSSIIFIKVKWCNHFRKVFNLVTAMNIKACIFWSCYPTPTNTPKWTGIPKRMKEYGNSFIKKPSKPENLLSFIKNKITWAHSKMVNNTML